MIYPILKLLHIMSATILFGGGIFAALLGTIVFGSKKVKVIAEVGPHIVKVESYLTVLSALAQIITGWWMASLAGFPVWTGWLGWALVLFCIAGLCWIPGVWLQHRMVDLCKKASETSSELPAVYHELFKNWTFLGLPSTAAMIGIFYLMVFKSV
ncbi:DUF2269 domain-containing protein [Bradyrhizobium liaoningense]|uniref:DUF2269 family protein n=1 Tax=Bradyrhizobium liaoningense TaxID=43992 RepID=UPI001BA64F97|nr:DUF2269 domain-containing protein [Bradyrhizobium liaoningense]MBR0713992.1 DUF2269 domain-containing protein [Bradyrhizobium liaoningense]